MLENGHLNQVRAMFKEKNAQDLVTGCGTGVTKKKGVKDNVKFLVHNTSTYGNADFEILIDNPRRKRS